MRDKWLKYLNSLEISDIKRDRIEHSIEALDRNSLPIVLDRAHFSQLVGIKDGVLNSMRHKPSKFYRKFSIPKKRGGVREIATPFPSLLSVQRWLYEHILAGLAVHDSAFAYREKRSIVMHAQSHVAGKELLAIDLMDFFGSIKKNSVYRFFKKLGYLNRVSLLFSELCTLDGVIPQGAATSPPLSNLFLFDLDSELYSLSNEYGFTYTRYADDIYFSGGKLPGFLIEEATRIINKQGFRLNEEKTRFFGEKDRKIITGLVVEENQVRIPKSARRKIRQEVHFILKNGLQKQIFHNADLYYVDRVLGRLNFWAQVEPNNEYVKEILPLMKRITRGL